MCLLYYCIVGGSSYVHPASNGLSPPVRSGGVTWYAIYLLSTLLYVCIVETQKSRERDFTVTTFKREYASSSCTTSTGGYQRFSESQNLSHDFRMHPGLRHCCRLVSLFQVKTTSIGRSRVKPTPWPKSSTILRTNHNPRRQPAQER